MTKEKVEGEKVLKEVEQKRTYRWKRTQKTSSWKQNTTNMSIYYALIARGTIVLVDYTEASGNFEQITASILPKIPNEDTKCTYVSQG